ncbi:hypothetical protein G1K66_01855 [Tenacibaculum finnmarkense]|uniref:hypothetical protein n=1 Tax=Tenacibaculum finnmarkense TaxID=2781243 RepID=UPI001E2F1F01|nr:hypothetical protein [Tenacibaculum finnmarkense]MCD8399744.1 hypothetical protein [Tenacibaculum finnmarkense genomovar ulcerans]MCG8784308.1 hypothetical protein [Tenacibaculum finnmarkense]MCG8812000.1 hypothetical protein [Tenacibaculum finnmarkense]
MKNSILNLGKALNKAEQQQINGGYSKLYCLYHSTEIKVLGVKIHESDFTYENCRAM